jgi:hypothetical protein
MEANVQDDDYLQTFEGFKPYEILKVKRDLAIMEQKLSREDTELNKSNFYKFISEHDKRRNTNFLRTFPELRQFWKEAMKSHLGH